MVENGMLHLLISWKDFMLWAATFEAAQLIFVQINMPKNQQILAWQHCSFLPTLVRWSYQKFLINHTQSLDWDLDCGVPRGSHKAEICKCTSMLQAEIHSFVFVHHYFIQSDDDRIISMECCTIFICFWRQQNFLVCIWKVTKISSWIERY